MVKDEIAYVNEVKGHPRSSSVENAGFHMLVSFDFAGIHLVNWFMLLLLCTNAPLILCCDWFDCGSGQAKCEPVDLVTEDYDVLLCQRIVGSPIGTKLGSKI